MLLLAASYELNPSSFASRQAEPRALLSIPDTHDLILKYVKDPFPPTVLSLQENPPCPLHLLYTRGSRAHNLWTVMLFAWC